jgi:integrase
LIAKRDKAPGSFSPAFTTAAKSLGFEDEHFHVLRHTVIVALIKTGARPKVVQEFAGHHSAAFTLDRHGHVTQNMQREAAKRVNDLYAGLSVAGADSAAG